MQWLMQHLRIELDGHSQCRRPLSVSTANLLLNKIEWLKACSL